MKKIYPDNPTLYAQRIRASYQKYLKYHSEYPKFEPYNKALIKRQVIEAKKVVNLSDTNIIKTYFGNERGNAMLTAFRTFNKSTEIMIELDKIREKEKA
jgi:hypothetical protein